MRLVHQWLENPLIVDNCLCSVVVFERSRQFYEIVKELGQQCETDDGGFTISRDMKKLNFSKIVNLILGFPFLDHNPRRVVTALYKQLNEALIENGGTEQIQILLDQLTLELKRVGSEASAELNEIEAPSWLDVFKFFNLRFRSDFSKPEEALCDYIRVMQKYCGHEVFIMVNVLGFLDKAGFNALREQAAYEGFTMLFIESYVNQTHQEIACRILIIDQDLCEIVIDHV